MDLKLSVDINELAKQSIERQVSDILNREIDVNEYVGFHVESYVEQKLDDKYNSSYELSKVLAESVKKEGLELIKANLYRDELESCLKTVLLERLRELPIEDLRVLFDVIANREEEE